MCFLSSPYEQVNQCVCFARGSIDCVIMFYCHFYFEISFAVIVLIPCLGAFLQHPSLFLSGTSPTGNTQSSTPNEVAMTPPLLSPSSPPLLPSSPPSAPLCLSDSVLPLLTLHRSLWISTPDLLELKGLLRTPHLWPRPLGAGTGTDDARSATQWKKSRAEEEEMGTAPGPSPTRSGGKSCQWSVWAVPVVALLLQLCAAFNLDTQERVVFTGPRGSYFGYSVEFFTNSSRYIKSVCSISKTWYSPFTFGRLFGRKFTAFFTVQNHLLIKLYSYEECVN